jgi:hypothetical protein
VTIQGQGFSTIPSLDIVKFNGVAATVISATSTTLVVQVPIGALTGSISVSVGGNTAASTTSFSALPIPVITSVSPTSAAAGSSIPSFQVTGANLTGAAFSFAPVLSPPAVTIGTISINQTGTSAVLSLAISGTAAGQYALVASNAFGGSSGFPTASNTLAVGTLTQFVGQTFSILNTASPAPTTPATEMDGLLFSILNNISNGVSLGPRPRTLQESAGLFLSILNSGTAASVISSRVKEMLRAELANQSRGLRGSLIDLMIYGPDTDGDGIPDSLELLIGTNPYNPDSDGDGFPDGLELALGSDPLDALSKPSLLAPWYPSGTAISVKNQAAPSGQAARPNQEQKD